MLKVDLGVLAQQHRIRIDAEVPVDDPLWNTFPWRFAEPVDLRLDLQYAGADVVVRGSVKGRARLSCRRCLVDVVHELDEDMIFVYRSGVAPVEAEAQEVYPLPEKAGALDLTEAVREHVLLAVPEFVNCDEACRGFCPRCGTNLNEATCECRTEDEDPRWAALRRLRSD
ncbi:MAG: YceD family protein [Longimicrobiales bacterium]